MSPEVYQALADLVGAFPRIVMVAVGLAAAAVLVAMAVSEVVLRYGETGRGAYSALDGRDGLCELPSHVTTGREVTPPTGDRLPAAAGLVGVEEPGEAVSDSPAAPARPATTFDPLLSAGLPPGYRGAKGARLP